jgi:hypothetical protein
MKSSLIELFLRTEPPQTHICVADASAVTNLALTLHKECRAQFVTLKLRGCKMRSVRSLFSEWGAALQFPYYFGENWNAFEECVKDLDWLDAPGFVFIVLNADEVLIEADNADDQILSLMTILEAAAKEWSKPIQQGEKWDRPSKPFHLVFQADPTKVEAFRLRLKRIGANFSNLPFDLGG